MKSELMNTNLFRIFTGILLAAYIIVIYQNRKNSNFDIGSRNIALSEGVYLGGGGADENPEELGTILWLRDLGKAEIISERTSKPILILFQEVPGCATCQRFGKEVLSDPFITEIIETRFIPLCIYNNNPGSEDEKVLKQFGERSWNNPVLRVIDYEGNDWLPRHADAYSPAQVSAFLDRTFKVMAKPIPAFFENYLEGLSADMTGTTSTESFSLLDTSALRFIPMPLSQLRKAEYSLLQEEDYHKLLSPRQLILEKIIREHPNENWIDNRERDFSLAWLEVCRKVEDLNLY